MVTTKMTKKEVLETYMGETYNSLKSKMQTAYYYENSEEFLNIAGKIMKEAEKLTEAEYYALLDVYENLCTAMETEY